MQRMRHASASFPSRSGRCIASLLAAALVFNRGVHTETRVSLANKAATLSDAGRRPMGCEQGVQLRLQQHRGGSAAAPQRQWPARRTAPSLPVARQAQARREQSNGQVRDVGAHCHEPDARGRVRAPPGRLGLNAQRGGECAVLPLNAIACFLCAATAATKTGAHDRCRQRALRRCVPTAR